MTHSAVFKKFEKENLFQIVCAGIFHFILVSIAAH